MDPWGLVDKDGVWYLVAGTEAGQRTFRVDRVVAAEAATIILDGVRADEWRILVGDDAQVLDEAVRQSPQDAYEPEFLERLRRGGIFGGIQSAADAATD